MAYHRSIDGRNEKALTSALTLQVEHVLATLTASASIASIARIVSIGGIAGISDTGGTGGSLQWHCPNHNAFVSIGLLSNRADRIKM